MLVKAGSRVKKYGLPVQTASEPMNEKIVLNFNPLDFPQYHIFGMFHNLHEELSLINLDLQAELASFMIKWIEMAIVNQIQK